MLKHVLTIIKNQYRSNSWLFAELLIVSFCFWYIIDYTGILQSMKNAPLGFNIDNTYRIELAERISESEGYINPENKKTTSGEDLIAIVERLRQSPDIESVSLSISSQPYSSAKFGGIFKQIMFQDSVGIRAQEYKVTSSFFEVFNICLNKTGDRISGNMLDNNSIIISADTEELLTGMSNNMKKTVFIGKDNTSKQIVAVSTPIRKSEYTKHNPCFFSLLTTEEITSANNISDIQVCIRTKPDLAPNFLEEFTSNIANQLNIGNIYLLEICPTYAIRKNVVQGETSQILTNSLLLFFLSVNIFFGISGTFLFRTRQRQGEIGLRLAVGSTKTNILKIFITEGILLLIIAFIPMMVIAFNVGIAELVNLEWIDFTWVRFATSIFTAFILLTFVIIASIWYPAQKASGIPPVEALRDE